MKDQNWAVWRLVLMAILGKTGIAVPDIVSDRVMDIVRDMAANKMELTDETILKMQKDIDDVLRSHGLIKGVDANA